MENLSTTTGESFDSIDSEADDIRKIKTLSHDENLNTQDEYKDFFLRDETAYNFLKEDLKENGQNEPILVDPNLTIIDGHTRYEILKELKAEIKYSIIENENYIKILMQKQLGRRNLSIYQKVITYEKYMNDKNPIQNSDSKKEEKKKLIDKARSLGTSHDTYNKILRIDEWFEQLRSENNNYDEFKQMEEDLRKGIKSINFVHLELKKHFIKKEEKKITTDDDKFIKRMSKFSSKDLENFSNLLVELIDKKKEEEEKNQQENIS